MQPSTHQWTDHHQWAMAGAGKGISIDLPTKDAAPLPGSFIAGKYFTLALAAVVFLSPHPIDRSGGPKQCKEPMQVRKAASPPMLPLMLALDLRRRVGCATVLARWCGAGTSLSVSQVLSNTSNMCELQMLAKSCGKRWIRVRFKSHRSCAFLRKLLVPARAFWVQTLARSHANTSLSLCSADCSGRAGQPTTGISQGN